MITRSLLALACGLSLSTPSIATAGGFTGGSLSYGGASITDADLFVSELGVSGEYGINRNFSIQGSAFFSSITDGSSNSDTLTTSNLTLHGIYHLNDEVSLGLYIGSDDKDGGTFYGLEGGFEQGRFEGEAFLGQFDTNSGTLTHFGFDAGARASANIMISLTGDVVSMEGNDSTRVGLGADYDFGNGFSLGGEIGQLSGDDTNGTTETQTYVGLGIRYNFGAERGATFERRTPARFIAGY